MISLLKAYTQAQSKCNSTGIFAYNILLSLEIMHDSRIISSLGPNIGITWIVDDCFKAYTNNAISDCDIRKKNF